MKDVSQISTKEVHIGDIWWARFNYEESGNMGKIRPVLIKEFDDENELIKVQMITTKDNSWFYTRKKIIPFKLIKNDNRNSYLVNRYIKIPRYYLYRRVKSIESIGKYKLDENFK